MTLLVYKLFKFTLQLDINVDSKFVKAEFFRRFNSDNSKRQRKNINRPIVKRTHGSNKDFFGLQTDHRKLSGQSQRNLDYFGRRTIADRLWTIGFVFS